MLQSNEEPVGVTSEEAVPSDPGAEDSRFLQFFKRGGEGNVETRHGASGIEPDTAKPLMFEPSAEALKDPKQMVAEFRALVENDLEDGGSILLSKEHAAAMSAYYRAMDAEVAKAANGGETTVQAGEHMAELTREELIEFWKKYGGIAFLCLAL